VKTLLVGAITASLLAAVIVTVASLLQPPTYEASAKVLVNLHSKKCSRQICLIPLAPSASLTQLAREAVRIDGPSVAKEAIRRPGLEVSADELLDGLSVRQVRQDEPFIRLSYRDTDLERAKEVVGTVGRVAAERITGTGSEKMPLDTELTATVWEPATLPDAPASPKPLRNGLIALVVALVTLAALIEARRRVFGG
jgi:capsular polysaccharide biosynthesis protein